MSEEYIFSENKTPEISYEKLFPGTFALDPEDLRVVDADDRFAQTMGYKDSEKLIGQKLEPSEKINWQELTEVLRQYEELSEIELVYFSSKGDPVHLYGDLTLTQEGLILGAMYDHTDQANKLEELAYTDALTDLHNRRFFDEMLRNEISRSHRTNKPLRVLMLDVDNFKQVNDKLGHKEGDRYLQATAEILNDTFQRGTDMVFRYGGDEFFVLLPTTSDEETSEEQIKEELTNRLQQKVARWNLKNPEPIKLSLSYGFGVYDPEDGDTREELLEQTDQNMYEHKNSKK